MSVTSSIRPTNIDRETTVAERAPARGRQDVLNRPNRPGEAHHRHVNVGDLERVCSTVSGGALAAYGLTVTALRALCHHKDGLEHRQPS